MLLDTEVYRPEAISAEACQDSMHGKGLRLPAACVMGALMLNNHGRRLLALSIAAHSDNRKPTFSSAQIYFLASY